MCSRYEQSREERMRTRGVALKIIALVQESHGSEVRRRDLEEMVQKEIV